MGKIKVGIDISPLKNANRFRGVGFYTKNLVESLQSLIKENKKYSSWQINLIENWKLEIRNFEIRKHAIYDVPLFIIVISNFQFPISNFQSSIV